MKDDRLTKTGSGQTQRKLEIKTALRRCRADPALCFRVALCRRSACVREYGERNGGEQWKWKLESGVACSGWELFGAERPCSQQAHRWRDSEQALASTCSLRSVRLLAVSKGRSMFAYLNSSSVDEVSAPAALVRCGVARALWCGVVWPLRRMPSPPDESRAPSADTVSAAADTQVLILRNSVGLEVVDFRLPLFTWQER